MVQYLFLKMGHHYHTHQLIACLHSVLSQAGFGMLGYSGHSLRIRAATTAACMGMSDSLIQTLSRRKSSAFTSYIRKNGVELSQASAQLQHYWNISDNNNGPSTEPCRTPDTTGRVAELQPSLLTNWDLPVKENHIKERIVLIIIILLKRMIWKKPKTNSKTLGYQSQQTVKDI